MRFDVIYGDKGYTPLIGEIFCKIQSGPQTWREAGSVGDRYRIDVFLRNFFENDRQIFLMFPLCEHRVNAAVFLMYFYLRGNYVCKNAKLESFSRLAARQAFGYLQYRDSRIVARRFYTEHFHSMSIRESLIFGNFRAKLWKHTPL